MAGEIRKVPGTVQAADGTPTAPSVARAAQANTGLYFPVANSVQFATNGVAGPLVGTSGRIIQPIGSIFGWASDVDPASAGPDTTLRRSAAAEVTVAGATTATMGVLQLKTVTRNSASGGQSAIGVSTELLTIAAAANTDSVANLLPANSYIEAVAVTVITAIPTAATFTVGDATIAARFATGVSVNLNTQAVGLTHVDLTGTSGPRQTAAAKVRITPNLQPGAATGVVRIDVYWRSFTAGTT